MAHQAKKAKTENNLTAPWMQVITDVLEHKDNKEFLDAKNIVLATVQDGRPYARYHVHRGFLKDQDGNVTKYLLTTTDKLMPKVKQIESSQQGDKEGSPAEYMFWTSPTGDQIRVRGNVHLYRPDSDPKEQSVSTLLPDLDWEKTRLEQWKGLSGHLRATFLHKTPGSPVDEDFEEKTPERLDADAKECEEALKRFCLVVMEPHKVDWSQQNAKPPQRRTWTLTDGEWKEQRVAV